MAKSRAGAKVASTLKAAGKARTGGGATVKTSTPRGDAKLLRQAGSIASAVMRKLG